MPEAIATLVNLPLAFIRLSATNPRKSVDAAALEELVQSIAASGVAVPVLVRPMFNQEDSAVEDYQLVTGSRRFRACQQLDLQNIPAIVREMSDDEVLDIQIVENLQRADVHPMEEAEGYRKLIEHVAWPGNDTLARDLTPEDVARRVGKPTAYVAQRMRLLSLEVLAKRLFGEGHITLGQALLLARLTIADQVRAMVFLLGIAGWEIKRDRPAETLIAGRIKSWDEQQASESRQAFAGTRLVKPTEVELKRWIADNVLLLLKTAPWRLDDAALLLVAGPCTTCPKRSGSNAALFSDLTPEDDVCTDQICFAAKRKAFVAYTADAAKVSGGRLLKLSSKRSEEKLPELVTEKTLLKQGQWVPATEGSCSATANGLMRDGDETGRVLSVCPLQTCKVHKHKVDQPRQATSPNGGGRQESWEERQAREVAENKVLLDAELPVRCAVFGAMLDKLTPAAKFLQSFLASKAEDAATICVGMNITLPEAADADSTVDEEEDENSDGFDGFVSPLQEARDALSVFLGEATIEEMHEVAFRSLHRHDLKPSGYTLRQGVSESRKQLWRSAEHLGVDADAIARRVEAELAGGAPVAESAPAAKKAVAKKAPAKKAAAKKAPAKKSAGKAVVPVAAKPAAKIKRLSPGKRKEIAEAMKKRWAARRSEAGTGKTSSTSAAKKSAKTAAKKPTAKKTAVKR